VNHGDNGLKIDRVFSISIFALYLLFSSVSTAEEKNRYSPDSHQPSLSPHSQPTIFSVQMHTLTGGFEQHKRSVDLI